MRERVMSYVPKHKIMRPTSNGAANNPLPNSKGHTPHVLVIYIVAVWFLSHVLGMLKQIILLLYNKYVA